MGILVAFHIICGSLALMAGTTALAVRKGDTVHRASGKVFIYAMLLMSSTGAFLAHLKPERLSVLAGLLTFYLVCTAWLAANRKDAESGVLEILALLFAIATATYGYILGFEALNSPGQIIDNNDLPLPMYFIFSSIAVIGGLLDLKVIVRKGVSGKQRITRHLWRMCLAMLIATVSFFLGQAQVFPVYFQESIVLVLPVLAVLIALIYWAARVRLTGWYERT